MQMLATKEYVINEGYALSEWGTITDPGKFEGCPWAAVIFYDMVMDGASDEELWNLNGELVDVFIITHPTDRAVYDLADNTHAVTVYQNDQGFVYFSEWTKDAYEALVKSFEEEQETDERSQ